MGNSNGMQEPHCNFLGLLDAPFLDLQKLQGGAGGVAMVKQRPILCIDLSDLSSRKAQVTSQLMAAATDIGFFQVGVCGV